MTASNGSLKASPPTPAFVIDLPLLEGFVGRFRQALDTHWPGSILSYSLKTNSLPWLISFMRSRGVWAEVVSDTEYELALALGYPPHRIVFNGPAKSRARLRFALRNGSVVNLDAKREVTWAAELAREHPDTEIAVGLRVNLGLASLVANEQHDGGSRFGFDADNGEFDGAITELTAAGVRIAGLHLHRSSLTPSPEVHRAAASTVAHLIRSRGLELDWVDAGGGFVGSVAGSPTFEDYVAAIHAELAGVLDTTSTRLIVEPGGSLIAVPVEFHASVIDTKDVGSRRFVVTDGSRTNIDPLFRRKRLLDVFLDTDSIEPYPEQILTGFTCMEDDRILQLDDEQPELVPGDRIVFYKVGAYTMTFQPMFIEFLPAVYVRRGASLTLVRRKWGVGDFLRGNDWAARADSGALSAETAIAAAGAAI